jgi:hypothetical protein
VGLGAAYLTVYGDWIETIDRATCSSSGVTVSIAKKYNGLQNNTDPFKGHGRVDLLISTNNASAGTKTITLSGGVYGTSNVTFTVAASPTITDVSIPAPSEPFKEIVITFMGTGLQNALDPATGRIVRDNLINYITLGSDVSVSSVRIMNSVNSNLQLKIFFSGMVQDVSVDLDVRAQPGTCVPLINGLKRRVRVKTSNLKNYVKSIEFPYGSTVREGDQLTIRLNLLFPAPADISLISPITGTRTNTTLSSGNSNRKVWVEFSPGERVLSSPNGTQLQQAGKTVVLANVGDNVITLTLIAGPCGGGLPGQVNMTKIKTWMQNENTTLAPEYLEKQFGVQCR